MRKEKEIVIELNEKRRKPWHAASSWQMHSKKKKLANGYDRMETWSWEIDKGVFW